MRAFSTLILAMAMFLVACRTRQPVPRRPEQPVPYMTNQIPMPPVVYSLVKTHP